LLALDDWHGSVAAARDAIAADGGTAWYHLTLGNALLAGNDSEAAGEALEQAVQLAPTLAEAHNSLGVALIDTGAVTEAEAPLRQAIELNPSLAMAHGNLGRLYTLRNEAIAAVDCCRLAVELAPAVAANWVNLAAALTIHAQPVEALRATDRALELDPDSVDALNNKAGALDTLGRSAEAIATFDRAIKLAPDHAEAHFGRALAWLGLGNYEDGFADYEWRLKLPSAAISQTRVPTWDGSPLEGRTLLLHAEQGFGDTLQFVRFATEAAKRGGKVILACQPDLTSLLNGIEGVSQVVPMTDPPPVFDTHAPLASLPHLFGITLDTVPATTPYVPVPEAWPLEGPAERPNARCKVGLAWTGGGDNRINRRRSCPLEAMAPLLQLPDIAWYSLQVGPRSGDLQTVPAATQVTDLSPRLNDFADTARAMAGLDLVITIDTAVAHLAGALGIPVWVMLSHGGDWRYLRQRADSPWYPTMRLFRQPEPGAWEPVIDQVRAALEADTGLPVA